MREREADFRRLTGAGETAAARSARATERLDDARPELRPRGVGEILDAGLDALRARFAACAGLCIGLWTIPAALLAWFPPERWGPEGADESDPEVAIGRLAILLVNSLISTIVQGFATMVVALVVRGEFAGESLTIGAALRLVLRRLFPLVATAVIVLAISFAGMLACVLPYFYFMWRLSPALLVCVGERLGPGASLARSFWLTKGSFLRWLGVTAVGGVLVAPLTWFSGAAASAQVREKALEGLALSSGTYDALLWIATTLFLGVATAAGGAFAAAYYYDCRVRREALDLRERMARLPGARSAA